jgi:hypothetical protein
MWDLSTPPGVEKLEVDPAVAALPIQDAYYKLAVAIHPTVILPGKGAGSSRAVVVNPRYMMLGVGGDELVSDLPSEKWSL